MKFKNTFLVTLIAFLFAAQVFAQTTDAKQQSVERAMLNYIEGFYEGDTSKLIASVLPEVNKYGYWQNKETGEYSGSAMSFEQMLNYANSVQKNKRFAKPDAPKGVELFEIQDQTACGKVTASWGTDYILLGKYDGVWKIVHVLWQGPPKQ